MIPDTFHPALLRKSFSSFAVISSLLEKSDFLCWNMLLYSLHKFQFWKGHHQADVHQKQWYSCIDVTWYSCIDVMWYSCIDVMWYSCIDVKWYSCIDVTWYIVLTIKNNLNCPILKKRFNDGKSRAPNTVCVQLV